MKGCILIVVALCLFGCNNESPRPVDVTPDSIIHLAGNAGGAGASYWKNGVHTSLNGNGSSGVNSMWLDGSSVLIGGYGDHQDVIWQNGNKTVVDGEHTGGITLVASRNNNLFAAWNRPAGWVLSRNGFITPITAGWPTAMGILEDEAYIASNTPGNEHPWGSAFYSMDTYAQYCKNDQVIFKEDSNSYANAIFIHNSDIYMGGHLNHYPSLDRIACYWKNGQRVTLTDVSQDAEVRSLFVNATNVYAAGMINDRAVYWKDGVAVNLSNGLTNSVANSISVLGTDVYVAGRDGKYPAVWKNGVKQNIPNQEKQGEIKVVIAVSN
jgi:hypothetical protein